MIPYSNEYILQYTATLATGGYTSGLEKMKQSTEKTTSNINSNFSKLNSIIGNVTKSKLSLAAAAMYFGNKTRQAIQDMIAFQKQLTTVNTLLKGSQQELNRFGNEFINLSIRTGQAKEDIANGAYQALSSGISKEDLTNFLEIATKTAQAGLTTTETSIKTISSVLNAYKMSAIEATNVADLLLTIQNKGVTTVGELGAYLSDVTSISSSLNINLDEVGAAIATLTQNGNNTAKTMTMLKSMFTELSKEGQKAADVFKEVSGESFSAFIKNGGTLQEAMKLLEEHAKKTDKSLMDLFGNTESGSAALNLTGLNAEVFAKRLEDMKNKSGELNTSYAIATANIKSEWDKLCNAMDSKWRKVVIALEKPIYVTLKTIRKAADGDNSAFEDYDKNKKEVKVLEEKIVSIVKNDRLNQAQKEVSIKRYTQRIEKLQKEINIVEKKMAEDRQRQKELEAEEERKRILKEEEEKKESELQAITNRTKEIEEKEKQHKNNLNISEISYLSKKRDYISQQQDLLALGIISEDEYNRNIKIKNKELITEQEQANLESLRQMEQYYRSIDNIVKANEYKKKVIEVEIQIKENSISSPENREDLFLQAQEEQMKEHQANMLADEWEYLTQLAEMRENGSLSEEQIETYKIDRMREFELKKLELEAEQLQNRLNFYNSDEVYKQQAVDTLNKIEENALKQEEIRNKKDVSLSRMFSNLKTDIQKRSKDALLDTYEMVAKGQMKSLEDFKKFAALQLAEVMLSHGREAMTRGMSDTVTAISYATNPLTASLAPPKFASAAKNFAFATAMGVGANALYGIGEEENENTENKNNDKTKFDDSIDSRVESAEKESEGTVYIDVSDSQMAKVMIKQIEKELNDGYNITLIGKKR